jgi:hypothetical protein
MPTNYSNSVVYQIRCKDIFVKHVYIGSTNNFKRRSKEHEKTYLIAEREIEFYGDPDDEDISNSIYKFIYKNGGWDNWYIIVLGNYDCDTRLQLLAMESFWFGNLRELNIPLLNFNRPLSNISIKKIKTQIKYDCDDHDEY